MKGHDKVEGLRERQRTETVAEVRLDALKHNVRQLLRQIGKRPIIAVVKADAYGHGMVPVAQCLVSASSQIALLGVASLDEAIGLRKAKIKTSILIMTGCPVSGIPDLIRYRLTPALHDESLLAPLARFVKRTGRSVPVHLKVDTGMGRLGVLPEKAAGFIEKVRDAGLPITGLFSHFVDADLADLSYAREQLTRFKSVMDTFEPTKRPFCHMANSAATLAFPDAHLDGVRPGLMLYGYSPFQKDNRLKPVLTVKSRILSLKKVPTGSFISYGRTFITKRPTTVAVVAIGYAKGYPRLLSNQGEMIAKGKRVPVIGRVCMDMTLLDVTPVPSLQVGDWVTVIGREHNETISADLLAKQAQTIPYEILCGMGARIPRVYV